MGVGGRAAAVAACWVVLMAGVGGFSYSYYDRESLLWEAEVCATQWWCAKSAAGEQALLCGRSILLCVYICLLAGPERVGPCKL